MSKEKQIPNALKSSDTGLNHQHCLPKQAHFTPYNQLVISQQKSETLIRSVFDVHNYELLKLNRNTKLICESHEQGFINWEEYQKHLIDKHSVNGVFQCHNCTDTFTSVSEFHRHLRLCEEEKNSTNAMCVIRGLLHLPF